MTLFIKIHILTFCRTGCHVICVLKLIWWKTPTYLFCMVSMIIVGYPLTFGSCWFKIIKTWYIMVIYKTILLLTSQPSNWILKRHPITRPLAKMCFEGVEELYINISKVHYTFNTMSSVNHMTWPWPLLLHILGTRPSPNYNHDRAQLQGT